MNIIYNQAQVIIIIISLLLLKGMIQKEKVKQWLKAFIPKKVKSQSEDTGFEIIKVQTNDYEQQQWTQAQAQIINQLINMYNLIKITKHINIQEYLTLKEINQIICREEIQKNQIRKCLLGGLSYYNQQIDKKVLTKHLPYQYYSVRALLWQLSLEYLQSKYKNKWVSMMENNLKNYRSWVKEYIIQKVQRKKGNQIELKKEASHEENQKEKQMKKKDHPLNFSNQSKWKNYFQDVQLWKIIQKDIHRTRKHCKFFQQYFEYSLQNETTILQPTQITYTLIKTPTYSDSMTRILFIYLKNHPEEVYYQGMNEIIALIYYCLTNKNSEYFRRVSESNSYFIFEIIMSKFQKKHFEKGQQYANKFIQMLKKVDLRLFEEIEKNGNGVYSLKAVIIKWFLTGFLTQFPIDQCLMLWDGAITQNSDSIVDYFYYVGLAVVHLNRQRIIENENIISIFCQISEFKVEEIIEKTNSLQKLLPKILC